MECGPTLDTTSSLKSTESFSLWNKTVYQQGGSLELRELTQLIGKAQTVGSTPTTHTPNKMFINWIFHKKAKEYNIFTNIFASQKIIQIMSSHTR